METTFTHMGIWSLLPAVLALMLAIWSKRVIESLLLGILCGVIMIDYHANGIFHSLLYSIPNLFSAIVGHDANPELGLRGMGVVNGTGRAEVFLVILILGSFITILEKSGGAYAFGEKLTKRIKSKQGAQVSATVMGTVLVTSAYFSALATGTVFKSIFDKMRISRAKLAFLLDSTSAPTHCLIPISGWVAYMSMLMVDNIPECQDGVLGLVKTIPFNFYCILMLGFVYFIALGWIKDFGPMKREEEKVLENPIEPEKGIVRDGRSSKPSDMTWPLGVSVIVLLVLGFWNYSPLTQTYGFEKIPLNGNQMLILSFSLGIIVAFVKFVASKLCKATEFLDWAIEGTKAAIIGGMIIILAVTIGDILRAASPEGVGAAQFLDAVARNVIPMSIIPCAIFLLASFMGFATGTSWGVWAIMMPMGIPLAMAAGCNPYLVAAAVLSGGTYGDHCSPISDTTIMSSIGAGCDHITHVNTQLPYATIVGGISAVFFLVAGFIF